MAMRLLVDGREVAVVHEGQLTTPWRLAAALPSSAPAVSGWALLRAEGTDGRRFAVRAPAKSYAAFEARLYLDEQKRPGIGMFPRAIPSSLPSHVRRERSKPRAHLAGVASVEVLTALPQVDAGATSALELVDREGARRPVALAQLEALPRAEPKALRGKPGAARKAGWRLRDVVKHLASAHAGGVLVVAPSGPRQLTADELASDDPIALLRANRRGEFELAIWSSRQPRPVERIRQVSELQLQPPK
jgi:hypothetical protein